MSRRKVDGLADAARRAAGDRRVVLSAGSIDGAFLAALAKVQPTIQPAAGSDMASTWGEGVNLDTDKLGLSEGGTDGADQVTR